MRFPIRVTAVVLAATFFVGVGSPAHLTRFLIESGPRSSARVVSDHPAIADVSTEATTRVTTLARKSERVVRFWASLGTGSPALALAPVGQAISPPQLLSHPPIAFDTSGRAPPTL